jgi:hypothetical protein
MANVAIPIREFGNPNTSAWSESITLLQLILALMLQDGVKPASFKTLNLSIVKINDAINPDTPAASIIQADVRLLNSMAEV